jgi:hypothetical protein
MPLHLVGETIDKMRIHRQAEAGKLVQLMHDGRLFLTGRRSDHRYSGGSGR